MGIEEPFLHRSGAKSGDSKNNSKQALPPVGKNSVPKPDFCPAESDNGNIFNGVENSRPSLGNPETGRCGEGAEVAHGLR